MTISTLAFDDAYDVRTYDNFTWTTVYTTPFSTSFDQTYVANFTLIARQDSSGISAIWIDQVLFEQTSGNIQIINSPPIKNVRTPGAEIWDMQFTFDSSNIYIQVKGGTSTQPVGWLIFGNIHGMRG